MKTKKCLLVPYDFSNEANFALDHAYELAKATNIPIHLLHIVRKESEIEEWQIELQKVADIFLEKHPESNVSAFVTNGNLFKKVYEHGVDNNAYLAVMGTHGIKTINNAMKVIQKFSRIPFILVQRPVSHGSYKRICVPISSDKKSRAKFLWVAYLSNLFNCFVDIVYPETSRSERKAAINSNLKFAGTVFEKENIDFEVKSFPEEDYADSLYDFMGETQPNIVLLMTDKYKEHITRLKRPRNIELYKKIPIMCVNPRTDILKASSFN